MLSGGLTWRWMGLGPMLGLAFPNLLRDGPS